MSQLTFYHAPNSRSTGVLLLLEELGASYALHLLNLNTQSNRQPDYLAINPLGKVPAIVHNGALVTEQPAVYLYLADLYPAAGLTPAIGDPLRGPYLRWMVLYGASFEPAIIDHAFKREPAAPSKSPYGTYEEILNLLDAQLSQGPYLLGERFTAADVLWGMALNWTTGFGVVPKSAPISAYLERFNARPAVARIKARDAELAAAQKPAN
ncbi:glutathione S-transferase family protein [Ampullimonas aquatilis]|uniref:glutathione S-transferase family protein n=1 Tax=Ampullimonas aquatilis TaxID=1341549 RepID=UPI003C71F7A7